MKKKCLLGFMVVMFTLATWIGVSFAESSQFSIRKKCVNGWENGKTYTFNGKVSKKITLNAYYDYSEKPASYAWENRADYITVSVYKKTKNWLGITKWTKVKDVCKIQRKSVGNSFEASGVIDLPAGTYGIQISRTDYECWYDKSGNTLGYIILRGTINVE